jgi:hypothetical protein
MPDIYAPWIGFFAFQDMLFECLKTDFSDLVVAWHII